MSDVTKLDRVSVFTPDDVVETSNGYYKTGNKKLIVQINTDDEPDFDEVGCGIVVSKDGEVVHNTTIESVDHKKTLSGNTFTVYKCYFNVQIDVSKNPITAGQSPQPQWTQP